MSLVTSEVAERRFKRACQFGFQQELLVRDGDAIIATQKFRKIFRKLLGFLLQSQFVQGRVNFVRNQLVRSASVPEQKAVNRAWFVGQMLHELETDPELAARCQELVAMGCQTDESVVVGDIMGVAVVVLYQLRK